MAVHPDTTLVELCELFAQKTGNLVVEQPCVTPYKSWDYNPQKKIVRSSQFGTERVMKLRLE